MYLKKHSVKLSRRNNGSSLLELSAGALITLAVVALALNVCFALSSYATNDRACRDAARAAAQGTNPQEAQNMARAIVRNYNAGNRMISTITVTKVRYEDFGGNPPADTSPFVTVTTSTFAQLPAPMALFGKSLFRRTIPVSKTYTFPIVRMTVQS